MFNANSAIFQLYHAGYSTHFQVGGDNPKVEGGFVFYPFHVSFLFQRYHHTSVVLDENRDSFKRLIDKDAKLTLTGN